MGNLEEHGVEGRVSGGGSHQAAFKNAPRHCPQLNQIECRLGILGRQLTDRMASFAPAGDLEGKIRVFADFYCSNLKNPFKWNFTGNILMV